MARKRILQIITQLDVGGAENQLLLLCSQMQKENFDFRVITLREAGKLKPAFEEAGVRVLELPREKVGGRPGQLKHIASEIRSWKPEVVQTWLQQANHVGRSAAFLAGHHRVVATFRDQGFASNPKNTLLDFLQEPFTPLYLHNSASGRESYLKRVPMSRRQKHRLLPNGVDTDRFRPDPAARAEVRKQYGIQTEDPLVLMVSRLHPIKNPALFVETARIVRRKLPRAQFLLAGGGPLHGELQASLEKEPDSGIHLLGECREVPRLLAAADLAMLTSHSEGLSNSILEAFSASLPLVATRVGGNPELVTHGENGYLIPSDLPEDLASRLLALLPDRELMASLGRKGRQRVEGEFSVKAMVKRAEHYYLTLAESGKAPPASDRTGER
ncbi:MAG: glycosyltransferase [Candidatus Krumholzibacteria bacterium]|nr:glycosyltransferase [Candidatus Krumholzibacteria bacterium]MDP6668869.1 glycosyltransferase [Candidatus Krumholzibacteria bacterium]MDP6797008.1 glycosyltransferase [Candidatus Krumholzibacteria bacterium]MDP7022225.1 glycosyltransferase [Candidatus Krumholzibacteria bacterium]